MRKKCFLLVWLKPAAGWGIQDLRSWKERGAFEPRVAPEVIDVDSSGLLKLAENLMTIFDFNSYYKEQKKFFDT